MHLKSILPSYFYQYLLKREEKKKSKMCINRPRDEGEMSEDRLEE